MAIKNLREPSWREHCGIPPECAPQKDGASPHTSNLVLEYCSGAPRTHGEEVMAPRYRDLDVLDYFCRLYIQRGVSTRTPSHLGAPDLAILRN